MQNNNRDRKPLGYYRILLLVLFLILRFASQPVGISEPNKEVSYNQFIEMVDDGQVKEVKINPNKIVFTAKVDNDLKTFETGVMDDPKLTEKLLEAKVPVQEEIKEELSPWASIFITTILPIILIWIMFALVSRSLSKSMGGRGGSDFMGFGKVNAQVNMKSKTGKTFADVAGQEEAKESLSEVVDFLHKPQKYRDIGAVLPKGVLLVGPPGTGKTLLAQAVAGEANVPFFSISGSEFVEMFVGLGASKVRDLFKQAKEKAPCIIFIDEIDAIGKKRDVSGYSGNDEREQTLNQLLNEMDGFDATEGIVLLAATNRPEILDPALTRPGRFDRQVRVELPDREGRRDILKVHAKNIKKEEDIDYDEIAKRTAGTSGADLANIVNESALRAVREGRNKVREEDMEESIETVIAGQQKKSTVISDDQKKIIAYHEVGHALVTAIQTKKQPVTKITIIPRTSGALGYTMSVDEDEKYIMTKEELFDEICTLAGGRSAEELIFNTKTTGASNDIERATSIARSMVTIYGMDEDFDFMQLEQVQGRYLGGERNLIASPGTGDKIDEKVAHIIGQAHMRAIEILKENMDKLHEIANYLLEKETITGEEFMEILERKPKAEEELEGEVSEESPEEPSQEEASEEEDKTFETSEEAESDENPKEDYPEE